jgi:hypothetical protein
MCGWTDKYGAAAAKLPVGVTKLRLRVAVHAAALGVLT